MVPIQVGMLEASPLLPVSAAVKRAMQLTRDALEQCGYKIVDVAWPEKIWKKQRDLYFTMIANDANPKILEDIANSYEKFVTVSSSQPSFTGSGRGRIPAATPSPASI